MRPLKGAGIRGYFSAAGQQGDGDIVWLDATLEPRELAALAEGHLREFLQSCAG